MNRVESKRALAVKIAERIFQSGVYDGLADRIDLRYKDAAGNEKSGGGWCIEAAIDQIVDVLKERPQ